MDALIRKAVPDDAESIATVHVRSWQAAYRGQLSDSFLDGLDQELAPRAAFWRTEISNPRSPRHEIWVAVTDALVEGFVALGPERHADPAGEIYAIYVNPQRWDQGLGRTLFARATERLFAAAYPRAILWVLESNARARRFYEIAGWTLDNKTKIESLPGGVQLQEVRYGISFASKRHPKNGFKNEDS
jgi:ribosomal protein S18 acetylase RimI-like enzyme